MQIYNNAIIELIRSRFEHHKNKRKYRKKENKLQQIER